MAKKVTNLKTHDFHKSIIYGKEGERVIKDWFCSFNNVERYEDVSDNPEFQKVDIDGIVWLKNGESRTVEIKTDSYTSGNLFYETQSCVEKNTIGCMERTKAQYLYYYFTGYKCMYAFDVEAFRKWALQEHINYPNILKDKLLRNESNNINGYYHSAGFIIPLTYLESHFPKRYWLKFNM